VKIAIVAHEERAAMAEALMEQTNASFISWDDGSAGAEANHRKAWEWHKEHTLGWALVLEDDAEPVPGFLRQASAALAEAPSQVVSFYLGQSRPPQWQQKISDAIAKADANDAHWILSTALIHGVAVAIKSELIPSMLNWVTQTPLPIDEAISHWCRAHHKVVAYTHPSLVDHADTGTLIKHRDKLPRDTGRVAWRTGSHKHWTSDRIVM
jgi:hypothetical protein